jgi:hypothetical protein
LMIYGLLNRLSTHKYFWKFSSNLRIFICFL